MNIFGVGGWELALILIIMLIVAGPKRMAQWAYVLGQYVGQLRVMWSNMMDVVQKEFDDAGVDVKVPKELPNRNTIRRYADKAVEPLTQPIKDAAEELDMHNQKIKDSMLSLQEPFDRSNGVDKLAKNATDSDTSTNASDAGFGTWSGGSGGTSESDDNNEVK